MSRMKMAVARCIFSLKTRHSTNSSAGQFTPVARGHTSIEMLVLGPHELRGMQVAIYVRYVTKLKFKL